VKRKVVILGEIPTGQLGRPSKALTLDQASGNPTMTRKYCHPSRCGGQYEQAATPRPGRHAARGGKSRPDGVDTTRDAAPTLINSVPIEAIRPASRVGRTWAADLDYSDHRLRLTATTSDLNRQSLKIMWRHRRCQGGW
jgi:hypothetical protein